MDLSIVWGWRFMSCRIPRRFLVWATHGFCNLRIPGKSRDTCTMWSLLAARFRRAMERSRSIGVAQIRSCALVKQTFRIWLRYAWSAEDRPSRGTATSAKRSSHTYRGNFLIGVNAAFAVERGHNTMSCGSPYKLNSERDHR